VLGKAGVGKSALLVHVGLGSLLAGEQVLHVSLRETVDHTRTHYDEILRASSSGPRDAAVLAERGPHHPVVGLPGLGSGVVERHLELLAGAAAFRPRLVVVDGFGSVEEVTEAWPALLRLGREHGCAVWAGARGDGRCAVPEVTVVRLVPDGRIVRIVVDAEPHPVELGPVFDPTSLLVIGNENRLADEQQVLPHGCTLYSGGAEGAETAFGEAAERWGVHEVHFTFEGHLQARIRGRYVLSDRELATGDVSLSYVSRRLHRTYNDQGGLIRGVLQTLWHMVSRSQQVFVVGVVQEGRHGHRRHRLGCGARPHVEPGPVGLRPGARRVVPVGRPGLDAGDPADHRTTHLRHGHAVPQRRGARRDRVVVRSVLPTGVTAAVLLAPGAGAPSSSAWMTSWARRLAVVGPVHRFDYPYMRAGRRVPDRLPVLIEAHRAALHAMGEAHRELPVVLAGKSMGSRVGCHLSLSETEVRGLVCFGYPLVGVTGRCATRCSARCASRCCSCRAPATTCARSITSNASAGR
jgi:hypothetical protein